MYLDVAHLIDLVNVVQRYEFLRGRAGAFQLFVLSSRRLFADDHLSSHCHLVFRSIEADLYRPRPPPIGGRGCSGFVVFACGGLAPLVSFWPVTIMPPSCQSPEMISVNRPFVMPSLTSRGSSFLLTVRTETI